MNTPTSQTNQTNLVDETYAAWAALTPTEQEQLRREVYAETIGLATPTPDEQVYEMNCDTCGATHIYDNETTAESELEEHRGIGHAARVEQVA